MRRVAGHDGGEAAWRGGHVRQTQLEHPLTAHLPGGGGLSDRDQPTDGIRFGERVSVERMCRYKWSRLPYVWIEQ